MFIYSGDKVIVTELICLATVVYLLAMPYLLPK